MSGHRCGVSIYEPHLDEAVRYFMVVRLAETLGEFNTIVGSTELMIQVDGKPVKVRVTDLIGNGAVLTQTVQRSLDDDFLEHRHYVAVHGPDGWSRIGQFAVVDSGDFGEAQDSMLKLAKFVFSNE